MSEKSNMETKRIKQLATEMQLNINNLLIAINNLNSYFMKNKFTIKQNVNFYI